MDVCGIQTQLAGDDGEGNKFSATLKNRGKRRWVRLTEDLLCVPVGRYPSCFPSYRQEVAKCNTL